MHEKSTFLYYYTLNEDQEECGFYDLTSLMPVTEKGFQDVYQYLDSLCVEAPEYLVKRIMDKV